MAKQIKYYKSINEITVYSFYKVLDTKNVNFIIKKYKENMVINEGLKTKLENTYSQIIDDYNDLTATKKNIKEIKFKAEIDYLTCIYDTISFCLKCYSSTNDISFLETINKVGEGFVFNKDKDIIKEIKLILKKLKGLKMKIKIKKIKYSDLYKLKIEEKKETNYVDDLDKISLNIEMTLELKYHIDIKKTTLLRWVNLLNTCKEKQEQWQN